MKRALVLTLMLLSGCASASDPGLSAAELSPTNAADRGGTPAVTTVAAGSVQLTPEEIAMDCRKLRGRMQIRIIELKTKDRHATTDVSRTAQQLVTPIFGGPQRATDPEGERVLDRARLDAYNKQLAAKGCKTVDIEAELKGS
jgi:hypothetical protein